MKFSKAKLIYSAKYLGLGDEGLVMGRGLKEFPGVIVTF